MVLYWNTSNIIPSKVPWRNNDYHLMNQKYANMFPESQRPAFVQPIQDVPLDTSKIYTAQQIADAKMSVFKFAAQFYVTVLQRSVDKQYLPDMVRYLKAYINEDVRCAEWLVNEFVNHEIIKETLLQNSTKIVRRILSGILVAAMLRLYESEKDQLNEFWDDHEAEVADPRQTTLGRFILTLLYLLPQVKDVNNNQCQFLQLIARFAGMGFEARRFLLRAGVIERLLNYFYWDSSPFN